MDYLELAKALGPIIVGLTAAGIALHVGRNNITLTKYGEERKEIFQKLNKCYGPMSLYLSSSHQLWQLLRTKYKAKDTEFSTLKFLLEKPEQFDANDRRIITEILDIVSKLEKLVIENAGLVDDVEIRSLLAKGMIHFRILQSANNGDLKGEYTRFEQYVFPRELETKVDEQIAKLKSRLGELNE